MIHFKVLCSSYPSNITHLVMHHCFILLISMVSFHASYSGGGSSYEPRSRSKSKFPLLSTKQFIGLLFSKNTVLSMTCSVNWYRLYSRNPQSYTYLINLPGSYHIDLCNNIPPKVTCVCWIIWLTVNTGLRSVVCIMPISGVGSVIRTLIVCATFTWIMINIQIYWLELVYSGWMVIERCPHIII